MKRKGCYTTVQFKFCPLRFYSIFTLCEPKLQSMSLNIFERPKMGIGLLDLILDLYKYQYQYYPSCSSSLVGKHGWEVNFQVISYHRSWKFWEKAWTIGCTQVINLIFMWLLAVYLFSKVFFFFNHSRPLNHEPNYTSSLKLMLKRIWGQISVVEWSYILKHLKKKKTDRPTYFFEILWALKLIKIQTIHHLCKAKHCYVIKFQVFSPCWEICERLWPTGCI